MNRDTKYRVWDNLTEKFEDTTYNAGEQFGHPSSCDWCCEAFTGLKDKNGKEIYIGDYVQELIFTEHGEDFYSRPYEIIWHDYGIQLCMDGNHTVGLWEIFPSKLKVVGNIHQHPFIPKLYSMTEEEITAFMAKLKQK